MRLGGPTFDAYKDPGEWVAQVRKLGYRAVYCPLSESVTDEAVIHDYAAAAAAAGIVIAEAGAWSNPLSPDPAVARAARDKCVAALALAERIGARCAVNIAGSRGAKWDGPCPQDLTEETFEMIVASVRGIIDAVKPTRSFYTLETMPWMYPDSADAYLRLLRAIDRPAFAVHFDPCNLINCPGRYFDTGSVIREFCAKLGGHIRSCHAKDILLGQQMTTHLSEVPPGQGGLDYRTYIRELDRLSLDMPLMMEHMQAEQYAPAGRYIQSVATQVA